MDRAVRDAVRQRALGRCEYCRLPEEFDVWPFHVEHVISRQHRGDDQLMNLAWACRRCNLCKGPNIGSIDPSTGMLTPLFDPRRQVWDEHFHLTDAWIYGVSAVGRATSLLLEFNAPERVQLRQQLIARGFFH